MHPSQLALKTIQTIEIEHIHVAEQIGDDDERVRNLKRNGYRSAPRNALKPEIVNMLHCWSVVAICPWLQLY